jgi:hypothetical protein
MIIKVNYKPHYYQRLFHDSPARFRLVCAGRRFGKSLSGVAEAFKMAVDKPKQRGWIIAPTYKQSEETFRILKEITPSLAIQEIRQADRKVIFRNGSEIEFKSADNYDSLRGSGLDFVLMDEASRIKEEAWNAIRPSLADRKGKAIFISTPKGRNWFHALYLRGKDPSEKEYESWRFSSKENPYFDIQEYNELKKSLPADVFSQEIEAEFIDNASAVFRNIKDRIKGSLEGPQPNKTYRIGADLAKTSDFTAICILDQNRHLVEFDRFQKMDWNIQKQRIISLARKYNNASVLIDSTGLGDPILDDLQEVNKGIFWGNKNYLRIEGFKFTNQSKNQLIQALQLAFETEAISYPNIPVLIDELEAYEYEILTSGSFRYSAPPGLHDDAVTALALANWNFEYIKPVWHGPSRTLDISFRPGAR